MLSLMSNAPIIPTDVEVTYEYELDVVLIDQFGTPFANGSPATCLAESVSVRVALSTEEESGFFTSYRFYGQPLLKSGKPNTHVNRRTFYPPSGTADPYVADAIARARAFLVASAS